MKWDKFLLLSLHRYQLISLSNSPIYILKKRYQLIFSHSWNIQNTDDVHLSSIGNVNPFDTRSVRIPDDQKDAPFFTFTITATQYQGDQRQQKQLQIKNSDYRDSFILETVKYTFVNRR